MIAPRRRLVSCALVVSLLVATTPAWSEPSAADRSLAQALFKDGRRLLGEGKIDEACAKLTESQRIVAQLGTLLNLAVCHEKQGKVASASAEFSSVITQAMKAGDAERETIARDQLEKLANRIPKLVISADAVPPGLEVRLDGTTMSAAALGAPLPIDPGEHEVVATAPAKVRHVQKVQVPVEATTTTVRIPVLADEPSKLPPPAPAPPPDRTMRTVGFVALGVGVLGVGLGTYFGLRTLSAKADANCPEKLCKNQSELDKIDRAQGFGTLSTISFLVGVVGLGAGAYFVLTSPSPSSKDTVAKTLTVVPLFASTGGGLSLRADW